MTPPHADSDLQAAIERIGELLATVKQDTPLPWSQSVKADEAFWRDEVNGMLFTDGSNDGIDQRRAIGKFWGGCTEWSDNSELMMLLVNNAPALLSAATLLASEEMQAVIEAAKGSDGGTTLTGEMVGAVFSLGGKLNLARSLSADKGGE